MKKDALRPAAIALASSVSAMLLVVGSGSPGVATTCGIDPSTGPVGATITIAGCQVESASEVRIGEVDAEFSVGTEGDLEARVPQGAVTGPVEVDTDGGTISSTEPFTVLPNIVFVVADDQRWDTLSAMPWLVKNIGGYGVTFTNAFVPNPVCCPSRATLLTGRFSHDTGVWTNSGPYGGFGSFHDDATTIATTLDEAGYATGFFGKYLNGYQWTDGTYVPPGWDRWRAFAPGGYYDFALSLDGEGTEAHGAQPEDYSTDVLADHVEEFIRTSSPQSPLFIWFAPRAPHEPHTPAPRHLDAFEGIAPWRPPSYMEADVTDKPAYIAGRRRLWGDARTELDTIRQRQLETLLSLDEAVAQAVDALADTGRLGDTIIAFTSDNGFLWGEHRLKGKAAPYEESIRVPLVIRWDRIVDSHRTDPSLVASLDLPSTFADAAETTLPGAEGRSLVPLLEGPSERWRRALLLEHYGDGVPSYCGVRTRSAVFIHYATGEEEYYRLAADPFELENLAASPEWRSQVDALRYSARNRCDPLPPGMPSF